MKTIKPYILTVSFLMFSFFGFAQNFARSTDFETGGFIDKDKIAPEMIMNNTLGNQNSIASPSLFGNQVFITQIGAGNQIETNITSSDAVLEIRQNGYDNVIDADLSADRIRYKVVQNGSGNLQTDNIIGAENVTLDLLQEGNNHTLERYGSNSIGNSLKFEMKGESQTVIVRNFK